MSLRLCEGCRCGSALFDTTRLCCRVRLLLAEPRAGARRALLARFETRCGTAAARDTETMVRALWPLREQDWRAAFERSFLR